MAVVDAASLRGPAGVLAVLLLEAALGSLFVLAIAPVWGVVKRGYFLLVGWTVAVCAVLAALSAAGPLSRAGSRAGLAQAAMWAFVGLSVVVLALLQTKRFGVARLVSWVACLAGVVAVV